MKKIKKLFILLVVIVFAIACRKFDPKPNPPTAALKQSTVDLGTHKLAAFSVVQHSKYLIVFESGLGDDHTIWNSDNIALKISSSMDVVTYDRASHGQSERGLDPRDINRLQSELTSVIDTFANGRKIVLIGHSLGGFIIRDWAIKNPTRVAGLLFVDPSTDVFPITQAEEDTFYNSWLSNSGPYNGSTLEAKEWKNDIDYMTTVGNLPNVPVVVLTAMQVDASNTVADRQAWYNAHALLGTGVTDFTHIGNANSGHMMMVDVPQMLIDYINVLLHKLP